MKHQSTFWADFRKFIAKGNVLDMAVGVIIGGAFGKITTALVNNVIMPLLSLIVGGLNVSEWKWVIREAVAEVVDPGTGEVLVAAQPETAMTYGIFLQAVIDFLLVSLCIFVALRVMTKMQRKLSQKKDEELAAAAAKKAAEEAAAAAEEAERCAAEKKLDEDAKRAMIEICAMMKAEKN